MCCCALLSATHHVGMGMACVDPLCWVSLWVVQTLFSTCATELAMHTMVIPFFCRSCRALCNGQHVAATQQGRPPATTRCACGSVSGKHEQLAILRLCALRLLLPAGRFYPHVCHHADAALLAPVSRCVLLAGALALLASSLTLIEESIPCVTGCVNACGLS